MVSKEIRAKLDAILARIKAGNAAAIAEYVATFNSRPGRIDTRVQGWSVVEPS